MVRQGSRAANRVSGRPAGRQSVANADGVTWSTGWPTRLAQARMVRECDCGARLDGVAALLGDQRAKGTVGPSAPGEVEDVAGRTLAVPVILWEPGLRADAWRCVRMVAGQDGVEQVEGDADGAGDGGLRPVRRLGYGGGEDGSGELGLVTCDRLDVQPERGQHELPCFTDGCEQLHIGLFLLEVGVSGAPVT